ncbi:MAG TPA: XdhC family protein [Actinophytocola sp.]|nr:XdhC family protein [Actinophytocola sp.]
MDTDPSCAVAHGDEAAPPETRTLVAVFASPVANFLIRYGRDLGYRTTLVEPERGRVSNDDDAETTVLPGIPTDIDGDTDVVVTDHHRPELGPMLRDALALDVRWVGIMGNPRHPGPHVAALKDLGVPDADIARVHRPIGLNIGSRTPPEIAIATLAGLLADRNDKPGGFEF